MTTRALPVLSHERAPTQGQRRLKERLVLLLLLLLSDAASILMGFILAYKLRFASNLDIFERGMNDLHFYQNVIFILTASWLTIFACYRMYDQRRLFGGIEEYTRFFNASLLGMVLVFFTNFIYPEFVVARAWLLMSWLLIVVIGSTARCLIRRRLHALYRAGAFRKRTLILGANQEGVAIAQQLLSSNRTSALLVGFVDNSTPASSEATTGLPIFGRTDTVAALIQAHEIEQVIVASSALGGEGAPAVANLLDALQTVEVRVTTGLFDLLTTTIHTREEAGVQLVTIEKTRITGFDAFLKSFYDYALALLGVIVLSPLLAVLALAVRLTSPGPILHRRLVVGQGRRLFYAYKFRTMIVDADDYLERHPELLEEIRKEGKLKRDPRITSIGHVLRRYSLDELPQLFNVLRGQMSLIGPRMISPAELEQFGPLQHNLAAVKPGLTGLWQVSGRSDLTYADRVRLDMHYIRNHSLWLDLHILLRTIPVLLKGSGAY